MRYLAFAVLLLIFNAPLFSDTIYREGYLWDSNTTFVNMPEGVAYSVEIIYRAEKEGDLKVSTQDHSATNKLILDKGSKRRIRVIASGKGYYRLIFKRIINEEPVLLTKL